MFLFQEHQKRIAKKSKKKAKKTTGPATHELGVAEQLQLDLLRIKNTPHTKRIALKKQLINKYQTVFNKACKADDWSDSNFIFYNILWRFDVGNFKTAFKLAKQGFDKNLTSPFKSTFPTFVADTIFNRAKEQNNNNKTTKPFLNELVVLLDAGLNINPIPHAKIFKLYGDIISDTKPAAALTYFEKAQEFDKTIGVKGRIAKLTAKLK